MHAPQTEQMYEDLPQDPSARQQALQAVFGEHLVKLLDSILREVEEIVSSPERRKQLGRIRSRPYEAVAQMSVDDKQKALSLAEAAVAFYLKGIMAILDDEGVNLKFGPDHFVNYRLILQVLRLPDRHLVEEQPINRSPLPTLGERFGRWMNRFRWSAKK